MEKRYVYGLRMAGAALGYTISLMVEEFALFEPEKRKIGSDNIGQFEGAFLINLGRMLNKENITKKGLEKLSQVNCNA